MRANREGVGLGESRHTSCCCDTLRPLCRDRLFRVQALHEQVCPVVTFSRNAIHLVARAENALPRWGASDRKVLERPTLREKARVSNGRNYKQRDANKINTESSLWP
ncbi:hypothetical protein MRX96_056712 [Rhipicephalus microplus]